MFRITIESVESGKVLQKAEVDEFGLVIASPDGQLALAGQLRPSMASYACDMIRFHWVQPSLVQRKAPPRIVPGSMMPRLDGRGGA
jgi:hypothetical protein